MPAFTPKNAAEANRELMARYVALRGVGDASEGSVISTLAWLFAQKESEIHSILAAFTDSYGLAHDQIWDADSRLEQIVGGGAGFNGRLGASRGSVSGGLEFTRSDGTLAATYGAGSIIASRQDDPSQRYITTTDLVFAAGSLSGASPVSFQALNAGSGANCPVAAINVISAGSPDLLSVTNILPVTSGVDAESISDAIKRAKMHMASVATRTTAPAIIKRAVGFESSTLTRIKTAAFYRDAFNPGHNVLVIDDGYGLSGHERDAVETTGTIPVAGQFTLYFDGPAASTPTFQVNGVTQTDTAEFNIQHETGILHLRRGTSIVSPGDVWRIGGHRVYTGIIQEIQSDINGNPGGPRDDPGYRGISERVRVMPPNVQDVSFLLSIDSDGSVGQLGLRGLVTTAIVEYVQSLAPGETLNMFKLCGALVQIDGLDAANFTIPTASVVPASNLFRLNTNSTLIQFL